MNRIEGYWKVGALALVLGSFLLAGCRGQRSELPTWGEPHAAQIKSISVPAELRAGTQITITITTIEAHSGIRQHSISATINAIEHTVSITVLQMTQRSGGVLPVYSEPQYTVSFTIPTPGEWTIVVPRLNDGPLTAIREVLPAQTEEEPPEWMGQPQAAEITDFQLPATIQVDEEIKATLTLREHEGRWAIVSRSPNINEQAKQVTFTVLERELSDQSGPSSLPSQVQPWQEVVDIPFSLPSAGRWKLSFAGALYAYRNVLPVWEPYYEPYADWAGPAYQVTPGVELPEVIYARIPTLCTLWVGFGDPSGVALGEDLRLDASLLEATVVAWGRHLAGCWPMVVPPPQEEIVEFIFPTPGEWTLTFPCTYSEPIVRTLEVLGR